MPASLMPMPKQAFYGLVNGVMSPIVGGKVYTYEAGTTTPKATYTTAAGDVANANPVILDSRGEASVWLGFGAYDIVLKGADDALIWTQDGVRRGSDSSTIDFQQAGTGAVGRTAQAKMREIVSAADFGAVGDGVADDTAAIQAAINTGKEAILPTPSVAYRTTAPITIATGQKLIGSGPRPKILVDHAGDGVRITNKGHLENVTIDGTTAVRGVYTAVAIGAIGQYSTHGIVENVYVWYPKTGFHLRGGSYWYTINNVDVFRFKEYGILLDSGPNNNIINFKQLASTATETTPGSSNYDWGAITWEQAAIKVQGHQNIFTGGEPAPSKWGVIVDAGYTGNRFSSMYMEHQYCVLKAGSGSETFWDCSAYGGILDIDLNAIVVGPSGNRLGINSPLGTAPIAAGNSAKAIWFFNEGYGSTIYDQSGNGQNLLTTNTLWADTGKWGKMLSLDAERTRYINDIPLGSVDWTQPFTFVACMKIPATPTDNFAITLSSSGGRYASISVHPGYFAYIDYDGSTVTSVSWSNMKRSEQDGFKWVAIYFDPVNKTLSSIDPVWGLKDGISDADAPRFAPWTSGGGAGITSVALGRRATDGMDGGFSFAGFWQRKLTLPEVNDLVNMTVPNLWPSAAPVRLPLQADSTAADVAGLKADFNALLAKMRAAGLLKT